MCPGVTRRVRWLPDYPVGGTNACVNPLGGQDEMRNRFAPVILVAGISYLVLRLLLGVDPWLALPIGIVVGLAYWRVKRQLYEGDEE